MLGLLAVSLLLVGANALFVVMEYSLVRARTSRIELLARKGDARALSVQYIQSRLDDYLAAVQVGITAIGLSLGWIGQPTLAALLGPFLDRVGALPHGAVTGISFALGLAVLTLTQIVLGELVPRSIAFQKAEAIALWGAYPLRLFAALFRPAVAFMSWCSVGVVRLLGFKPAAQADSVLTEDEMRIMLGETQEKGSLPLERLLLLENLFDIGQTRASEVMIPRDKVVALSLKNSWEENLALIRSRRFSRYPLCENGLDTALGLVHVKDLVLKGDGAETDLRLLRRDIAEVKEGEPLERLLKSFPDKGIHMALVRDSQGRVAGLLTLEDIVEELVGEIHDEFDLPGAWSLADLVVPQAVVVGVDAPDRRGAIAVLLGKLAAAVPAVEEEKAFLTVWEREVKFSSAVGKGVAVPHGRIPGLERPFVAVGRFSKPIPFPSPDNAPVRLVFLILTPAATPVVQLKILGRIASLVTNENLRRKLLRAKTAESLLETLRTADTMLAA